MKKLTKILLPITTIGCGLMGAIPMLSNCGGDGETPEQEQKHVSNVKVQGEVILHQQLVITYTIDKNYTLDIQESSMTFGSSNEVVKLTECEVDSVNNRVIVPAVKVTSKDITFDFKSMKPSVLTEEEFNKAYDEVFARSASKNLTFTLRVPDATVTNKLVGLNTQTYTVDDNGRVNANIQAIWKEDYRAWLTYDKTLTDTNLYLNPVTEIDIFYYYVVCILEYKDFTYNSDLGAYVAEADIPAEEGTVKISLRAYFNKSKQLSHVLCSGLYEGQTSLVSMYITDRNKTSFDIWDELKVEPNKAKNCYTNLSANTTGKSFEEEYYPTLHEKYVNSLAIQTTLAGYTDLVANKPLKTKFCKYNYIQSEDIEIQVKLNGNWLTRDTDFTFDKNTCEITITKPSGAEWQTSDTLYVIAGQYTMGAGMSKYEYRFARLYQEGSKQTVKAKFFKEDTTTLYDSKIIEENTILTNVPTPPEKTGYIAKGWSEQEYSSVVFDFETIKLTDNMHFYPVYEQE